MAITITPAVGAGNIDLDDLLRVDVVDSVGSLVHVSIYLVGTSTQPTRAELVFDNLQSPQFSDRYDNGDAVFQQVSASNWNVRFKRTANGSGKHWDRENLRLMVTAVNNAGTTAVESSLDYQVVPNPEAVPTVASFVPAAASLVEAGDPIQFDVTSTVGVLDHVEVHAVYADRSELVLRGDAAGPPTASAPYNLLGSTGISGGRRYEVENGDGWPDDFEIRVFADQRNALGEEGTAVAAYTLTPPAVGPDVTSPTVGSVSPSPGTPIGSTQPLQFDVTDDSGIFRRILVAVVLSGVAELAHDGSSFLGNYGNGGCSRVPIAGGFRFTILRDGGWPSSPTVRVFAIDAQGNEA